MSTLSIRIPDYLHKEVKKTAAEEKVSINQFIMLALAEKIAALNTESYIEARAQKGNRKDFLDMLSKVPSADPQEFDKI